MVDTGPDRGARQAHRLRRGTIPALHRRAGVPSGGTTQRRRRWSDCSTPRPGARFEVPLRADVPPQPGRWADYPITVIRRVARDFATAVTGMDAAFRLDAAAGVGTLLLQRAGDRDLSPARRRQRPRRAPPTWQRLASRSRCRRRLPRRGREWQGVRAVSRRSRRRHARRQRRPHGDPLLPRGQLSQYHFLPVTAGGRTVALPDGMDLRDRDVRRARGQGKRRPRALQSAVARDPVNADTLARARRPATTPRLFAALRSSADAPAKLEAMLRTCGRQGQRPLLVRLAQFRAETEEIIPAVSAALRSRRYCRDRPPGRPIAGPGRTGAAESGPGDDPPRPARPGVRRCCGIGLRGGLRRIGLGADSADGAAAFLPAGDRTISSPSRRTARGQTSSSPTPARRPARSGAVIPTWALLIRFSPSPD